MSHAAFRIDLPHDSHKILAVAAEESAVANILDLDGRRIEGKSEVRGENVTAVDRNIDRCGLCFNRVSGEGLNVTVACWLRNDAAPAASGTTGGPTQ